MRCTRDTKRSTLRRTVRALAIAAAAIAVSGCATGPAGPSSGSRYKGDAVWDIARVGDAGDTGADRPT